MRACLLVAVAACGRIAFDDDDGAPSCAQLPPSCGGTASAQCCDSPLVPGGTFYRSYDGVGYDSTASPATVSAFRLDKYEVTVARFREFVNAGRGTQATAPALGAGGRTLNGLPDQGGWTVEYTSRLPTSTAAIETELSCNAQYQTWTASNDNRPINCVSWELALAFCIWDGGYLPTEAEWNFAAAGGDEQRAYPWSQPPTSLVLDASLASYAPTFDTDCVGDGLPGCTLEDIIEVGSKPAGDGRWGHSDLAGNLYEWTLDWYEEPYPTPCMDCVSTNPSAGLRSFRGGAFRYAASGLRNGYRNGWTADDRSGVRCARPP